jgi:hypothetical protein
LLPEHDDKTNATSKQTANTIDAFFMVLPLLSYLNDSSKNKKKTLKKKDYVLKHYLIRNLKKKDSKVCFINNLKIQVTIYITIYYI